MKSEFPHAAVVAVLLLAAAVPAAFAEGRTVAGTIEKISASEGAFTVKDAAGVSWRFKVAPDAGIDLAGFRVGDRVTVTIGRATPLNMISAADRVEKGDRLEKTGY